LSGSARHSDDRQPPIDQVDLPERSHQDVSRLDVAVKDAAAVREGDRFADLQKRGHHLAERLGETGLPPGALQSASVSPSIRFIVK
jgi:hypothetical protein